MSNDFQDRLNDPQAPMATSLSDVGAPLLVAFGGIAGKVGILPFEFFNLTKGIKASRIFVRDVHRAPGRRHLDVKPLLRELSPSCGIDTFYCRSNRLDRTHAERLSFAPNVHTHSLSEGGHSVIKRLRSSRTLTKAVRDALGRN